MKHFISFRRHRLAFIGLACGILVAPAQEYDLSEVTRLAEGALVGENVGNPVSGFEIRILRNGLPIYHQVFGDWSSNKVANLDSSTKTLTAATIMSVTESSPNPFSLETRISDYLPSFDTAEKRDITIRQAFSHTSGFSPGFAFWALYAPGITLLESANAIAQEPLAHLPGTAFDYGSLSMQTAGAAAEAAAGLPFVDLFAQRITTPLGLTKTRFLLASQTNPRIDGGVTSTASDFARFMDALLLEGRDRVSGQRILSAASVQTMRTRQTTDDMPIFNTPTDNDRYGIGVWLDQLIQFGPAVPAIAAGARGFHSWIEPTRGLVLTCATDQTTFANLEGLASLIHAEIVRVIPKLAEASPPSLRDVLVVPPGGSLPPRFTGTVTSVHPFGTARLRASTDLGITDPWTDLAVRELDGYGATTFTNIPDTRPQALGAPQNFFRVIIEAVPPP
jgi:CubicO group peptidase (beta-lactamase class C family)